MNTYRDIITNGDTSLLTMIEQAEYNHNKTVEHVIFFRQRASGPVNGELREDGTFELREDGTFELRE